MTDIPFWEILGLTLQAEIIKAYLTGSTPSLIG